MNQLRRLNFLDLLRMFGRSFFIQAVWNYHSLVSIGFCYALVPAARRIFKEKTEQVKFLCRHLNFFNAHPYFASFAIGSVARVEEEQQISGKSDPVQVDRLKNALIGPLGAIGDQVFWANIKPSSILVAALGILVIRDWQGQLWCLAFMLLMYNVPHLYIRAAGLYKGYQLGFEVYKILNLSEYNNVKRVYGAVGAITLGAITGFSFFKFEQVDPKQGIVFVVSMVAVYYVWKWRQNFYHAVLSALLTALLLGMVFELV
jgi:PTS system mannose-specific IID component